ncbi:MAG: ATP-binding protein [Proteobacteria bacterium]|nr:ATP-binding protein [Pseudomonadota bacterium]
MKPLSFRIRKYRNIQDSGEVSLAEHLTCVVGKNQSGKTSLLKALHKFNPHEPEPYVINRDWPRGERRKKDSKQVVCEVVFSLDDEERKHLEEPAESTVKAERVTITKDYDGIFEFRLDDEHARFSEQLHPSDIDRIVGELPDCADPVSTNFAEVAEACKVEAQRLAREGRFTELEALRQKQEASLRAEMSQGNQNPQHQHENTFFGRYNSRLDEIRKKLESEKTPRQRAHDYLIGRVPTFIYMDDYREFHGTAQLTDLQGKTRHNEEERTFLMILRLAGLDLEQLIEQGASKDEDEVRERQHDLEDAAKTLTKDVAGRWGQNPYRIQFRADGQTFLTEIEETNKDIGMIPLEEQSKGFRWFFSFDLRFMHESNGTFAGCVLLLDEPGLHLHPGGQRDLIDRLDSYAKENTLIYTTHLPFLVDLREPERIRVMSEQDGAATVTADLMKSGKDERLTLQAAFGMKLDQHYLVADRNLVVEGVDDFWILSELSNLLDRSGEPALPNDVMISAAGGASEAVYMSTFMIGQALEVVTLFDSDEAGRREEEKLRTKWLLLYKNIKAKSLLLGAVVGEKGDFAIEDLFPEDFYLERFHESHRNKLAAVGQTKIQVPKDKDLLVSRVGRACDAVSVKFNKGS